jgi:hypothetical protein
VSDVWPVLFFLLTLLLGGFGLGSAAWFIGWPTWFEDMKYKPPHAGWFIVVGIVWAALGIMTLLSVA